MASTHIMRENRSLDISKSCSLDLPDPFAYPQASSSRDPNLTIAPFLENEERPPTPPPKPKSSLGFPHKPSFSTFNITRHASNVNLVDSARSSSRHSEVQSIADSSSSSHSVFDERELRKPKSARPIIATLLRRPKSRQRLKSDGSERPMDRREPHPPLPEVRVGYLPASGSSPPSPTSKMPGYRKKKKISQASTSMQTPRPSQAGISIDLDITNASEFVSQSSLPPDRGQPERGVSRSESVRSDYDSFLLLDPVELPTSYPGRSGSHSSNPQFNDPFDPSTPVRAPLEARVISPTSTPSSYSLPNQVNGLGQEHGWEAPPSWAVDSVNVEDPTAASSEDEPDSVADPVAPPLRVSEKKNKRSSSLSQQRFKIRVYTSKGTYHVLRLSLATTVEDVMPELSKALLGGVEKGQQQHRLHLREKGRERLLASTERPANIVRRRLEQAGYEASDGLDDLAEDSLSFLLKFFFKSLLLSSPNDDMNITSFESVDLSARALRAIPAVLHAKAEKIEELKISRNPMLDLPLDFIQSCTALHSLEMSSMSIKKIPHSVRSALALKRLDLSCNRIADLEEAGLDHLEQLRKLEVQNNKMEALPWYFPRLVHIAELNLSNNKFKSFPSVLCKLQAITHLDISFNSIAVLPEDIGKLTSLQQFILVGNQITHFPEEINNLRSLQVLDCRRNLITDLRAVCMLEGLHTLTADHNAVHALDLSIGSRMRTLNAAHNEITRISLLPGPMGKTPYSLVRLDLSYARLPSLDDLAFSQLTSLEWLRLDHNSIKVLPDSLCSLSYLTEFSCCHNLLTEIPRNIGHLLRLEKLDLHCNSLKDLPASIWGCASLREINLSSNLLTDFHDPPEDQGFDIEFAANENLLDDSDLEDSYGIVTPGWIPIRKTSAASISAEDHLNPHPLSHSLHTLLLGENQITEDGLLTLFPLDRLQVLNLSFNQIQDLPEQFFKNFALLEKLYLSGNKLASLPTDALPKVKLSVLFLNGNKLQTLPQELAKVQTLTVLDVGKNLLKYNINNWEFDWNWNFNVNLRYLNLSGNQQLKIKSDVAAKDAGLRANGRPSTESNARKALVGFTGLGQLRVLGLMDVTIVPTAAGVCDDIPDENEDRRVRTSTSVVNGMPYGIADNLGSDEHVNMFDLVHEFRGTPKKESIFAMFGRTETQSLQNSNSAASKRPLTPPPVDLKDAKTNGHNQISKYLVDNFLKALSTELNKKGQTKQDTTIIPALRRTFLNLHKELHDKIYVVPQSPPRKMSQASASTGTTLRDQTSHLTGASGIAVYFIDRTMYVANVGNCLAIVSKQGEALPVSRKHDPFDRKETARIRQAEGWVSPDGLVNGELDISRSFGLYSLLPVVNAQPEIHKYELSDLDEFVIVANRGLWDHVSFQTAVDIARAESADPMMAASKLRDFAMAYGADGSTMVMVIGVGNRPNFPKTSRLRTVDPVLDRLPNEVGPPTGYLALAFTDIVNSTHLWEVNPGMNTAMRIHNNVLRRQLRLCGGYEVKTEGDSFMCSFPSTLAAVWWCLSCQAALLRQEWPLEILECEDGKEVLDSQNRVISRGVSVRMGVHCGAPLCEPDPNTGRMDYFGPMVNRAARIMANANGGQVMCSSDVIREINAKVHQTESDTEFSAPQNVIDALKDMGISVITVGERKLKGLEVPELLSIIYPSELEGRSELKEPQKDPGVSKSRIQFSVTQMKQLGLLCLRLEALSSNQVFRVRPTTARSVDDGEDEENDLYVPGDPDHLLPLMNEKSSDAELMAHLQSFSARIENSVSSLVQSSPSPELKAVQEILSSLRFAGHLQSYEYQKIVSVLYK